METISNNISEFLISTGSYDGNLFGIRVTYDQDNESNSQLDLQDQDSSKFDTNTEFAFRAFEGSIRTMVSNHKFLAIGGFEEVYLHKLLILLTYNYTIFLYKFLLIANQNIWHKQIR